MNQDIRISIDFANHRKTKKLYRKLGAEGCFSLVKLWLSIATQRPDGNLNGYDKTDIEIYADWPGKEGVFFEELKKVGFIDEDNGVISLHNWELRQPWAADENNRSDKARYSRLKAVNEPVFNVLKSMGYNRISKKDFQRVSKVSSKNQIGLIDKVKDLLTVVNEPSTSRQRAVNNRKTNVNESLTPTPTPTPTPKNSTLHQNNDSLTVSIPRENFCQLCKEPFVDGACPVCGWGGEF